MGVLFEVSEDTNRAVVYKVKQTANLDGVKNGWLSSFIHKLQAIILVRKK